MDIRFSAVASSAILISWMNLEALRHSPPSDAMGRLDEAVNRDRMTCRMST